MQSPGKRVCPFCAKQIPSGALLCGHCGKSLTRMKVATPKAQARPVLYQIVPDGTKYGIALAGVIKIHGLDYEKALRLAAILNSVAGMEQAG